MNRNEIISQLRQYFNIRELVCQHTFATHGERSWMFISTEILHTLLVLRTVILNVPLVCNNWHSGGTLSQRGLRCNLCDEVKTKHTDKGRLYLSAHCTGRGLDLTSPRMTAEEMRQRIRSAATKLPYNVRIEKDKKWLHIDTYDAGAPVVEFSV